MNIIELARKAAASKGHTLKDVPEQATVEFIEAFANAVIAAHDAELIEGVGEPQLYGGITLYKNGKFKSTEDGYTAEQVAGAVAKYKAALNKYSEDEILCKQQERIAELEAQNKALLEALKFARRCIGHPDNLSVVDAAIEQVEQK